MNSFFRPAAELFNGDAYCPHPGDASLPLSRRFQGQVIVVIGGGGTHSGWTQRLRFDRGVPHFEGARSSLFQRSSSEWTEHLQAEANATLGWAVVLIEQQWQAALGKSSAASLGFAGVEQMLRVRDAVSDFGDDRMSEDIVRAAVDHPTMEGAVVAGARPALLDLLENEARSVGFEIAAVRIPTFSLIEWRLAQLRELHESPDRTLVGFDGQSALLIAVRDGAFDGSDGGLSYLVNRNASEIRAQLAKRLAVGNSLRETKAEIIGASFASDEGLTTASELREISADPILVSFDDRVRHDVRRNLEEMRLALPHWIRAVAWGGAAIALTCMVGIGLEFAHSFRLSSEIDREKRAVAEFDSARSASETRVESLKKEEGRAHQLADWIDRNYHAQRLVHTFLSALPIEVSLDAVSVFAAEGLPQAQLKFTLLGSEESQRVALRSIESGLYGLGYDVVRREDPTPSLARHGAVVYAWDLIVPNFGG